MFETKDSGKRVEYVTGARRDASEGKGRYDLLPVPALRRWAQRLGRYDLLPVPALRRWAQLMERGAAKYGERNWEKGIPLSRFLNSALRHLLQLLAGETDEDHAAAVLFNVGGFLTTQERIAAGELPAELDDRHEAEKVHTPAAGFLPGSPGSACLNYAVWHLLQLLAGEGETDHAAAVLAEVGWFINAEESCKTEKVTGSKPTPESGSTP